MSSSKNNFTYPVLFTPSHIDPVDLTILDQWDVFRSVHDKLFITESGRGVFEGVIADSWLFDPRKSTLTISIKDGLYFSDGSKITVEDVVFSLKRKIFLTLDKNPILPKCLGLNGLKVNANGEPEIAGIYKIDDRRFELKLYGCDQGILEELSGTNFAIVKKSEIKTDGKLKSNPIVSGAFRYRADNNIITLTRNEYNWRYNGKKIEKDFTVRIVDYRSWVSADGVEDKKLRPDFVKVTSSHVFDMLASAGYKHVYSVPNTTFILSLLPKNSDRVSAHEEDTLKFIGERIQRSKILASMGSKQFYEPAEYLFPKDMNCSPNVFKRSPLRQSYQPKEVTIELVSRSPGSNKGELFSVVKSHLEELGFSVFSGAKSNNHHHKPLVRIMLTGQHLGLRPIEVVNLMIGQLQQVSDPNDFMKIRIAKSLKIEDKDLAAKEICASFHMYNHITLLHRKTAFMASNEKLLGLFSPVTAAVHLEKLTDIVDDK